jgi:hypothetical protein
MVDRVAHGLCVLPGDRSKIIGNLGFNRGFYLTNGKEGQSPEGQIHENQKDHHGPEIDAQSISLRHKASFFETPRMLLRPIVNQQVICRANVPREERSRRAVCWERRI